MKISDDETRALAFIAALIGLTALGRWVDRPKAVLPDAAEVDIQALAMRSETALARVSGSTRSRNTRAASPGRAEAPRAAAPLVLGAPDAAGSRTGRQPPVSADRPLDLNRANAEQLEGLPGVGPALAARILARRDSAGPFRTLDQLDSVRGVGPALLARLKPLLRLAH